MSTADNRICLECKYSHYHAKQCFATGLCQLAVDRLQSELERKTDALARISNLNHNWDAESTSNFIDLTLKITEQALKGGE